MLSGKWYFYSKREQDLYLTVFFFYFACLINLILGSQETWNFSFILLKISS